MHIRVTFTTQVKAALGLEHASVSLDDGATVMDAIQSVAKQHGEVFERYVLANDALLPSILISLNDQQAGLDAKLSDGDQLILLSAISGG